MADRPLRNVMEPGWAEALEPVAGQIKDMGDFLRAETRGGTPLPARGRERAARLQAAVRRRAGADRRAGPLPDAGEPGRAQSSRSAPEVQPAAAEPGQHLTETLGTISGLPQAVERRPSRRGPRRGVLLLNRVLTVAAAQARLPPRQGLGGGHRPGHPRARGPRRRRWWPSCGAGTRKASRRCWAAVPASSRRTRARIPPTGASSARARSAARTSCWRSRAATHRLGPPLTTACMIRGGFSAG